MATRNAQVKLTLDSGEYLTELRKVGKISDTEFKRMQKETKALTDGLEKSHEAVKRVGEETKKAADEGARGTSRFQKGAESAREAFKDLGGRVKDVAAAALTLGGALSVGAMVNSTVNLQSRMVQLQNSMERSGDGYTRLTDLQDKFEGSAQDTNRTTEEMVDAFDAAKVAGASVEESFADLPAIGVAMSATGKSAEEMGRLAGSIRKQFPGADIEKSLAMIIGKADETGLTVDELSEDFGEMGSIAKQAGLEGEEGLAMVLGLAGEANKDVANMSETLTGLDQLFEKMRQTPVLEGLAESAGIAEKDVSAAGNAVERVGKLLELAASKGDKKFDAFKKMAMEEEFTGREEKAAFEALSKPFEKAYQQALDTGASAEEAAEAGAQAFQESVQKMASSNTTFADLQDQAAREAETPAAKLRQALEKVQLAFQKPEMIAAIEKLADALPKLADMIASVVSFAADSPLAATAIGAAGYGGMNFAQGALFGGGQGWGLGDGAKSAQTAAAVGNATKNGVSSGLAGWGQKIGAVAGPIMAAAVAAQVGKALIDHAISQQDEQQRKEQKSTLTAAQAMYSNDEAQIKEAIRMTERSLKETEENAPGAFRYGVDSVATGLGLMEEKHTGSARYGEALATGKVDLVRLKARLKEVQFQKELQGMGGSGSEGGEAADSATPRKVTLEDTGPLARDLAQGLQQGELRVQVMNMPGAGFGTPSSGGGGSRGPLTGGTPGSGNSLGG